MKKTEIRDKVEDIYIKETGRFAFLDPNKLDDRYIEWLESKVITSKVFSLEQVEKIATDIMNLGLELRQNQLNGYVDKSGSQVVEDYLKKL